MMLSMRDTAPAPKGHALRAGDFCVEDVLHVAGGRALLIGRQRDPDRAVVIERVSGPGPAALRRALAQQGILRDLAHPNLARCIDCFIEDRALYCVMVTGPGTTIAHQRAIATQRDVIDQGIQLCNALNYLAWRGIRRVPSIDPTTVFISAAGRVKLTNLTALLGLRTPRAANTPSAPPTRRAALLGLGTTLFSALTGWQEDGTGASPDLTQNRPDVTPEFGDIIARALDPATGWRNAARLRYALLQLP